MERLNILYACDNNYAPFCGVSVYSLFENNTDIEEIRVFIVVDNVSEENKRKLQETALDFKRELILIDATDVRNLMEKIGVPKYRGSYATHYRKFFQMILPSDVDYLLYLDADTIVPGSLKDLFGYNMHGKCMGVVLDTLGGRYKQLLGFKPDEPYFNAGITWIDVAAWKERNYSEKLMQHIKNVRAKYCNPDQDLFNLVLKGDTAVLPIGYNFQPAHRAYSDRSYFSNYPKEYYTVEQIDEARRDPRILHTYRFLGEFPWHKGNMHPDNALFDQYLKKTRWNDYEKEKAQLSLMFRIEKVIYRILPRSIFLFFFSKLMYIGFYRKNKRLMKET